MINAMLNAEDARARNISSIRFCYSAAKLLPIELFIVGRKSSMWKSADAIGSAEMFHITSRIGGDVKPERWGVSKATNKIVDAGGSKYAGEMAH